MKIKFLSLLLLFTCYLSISTYANTYDSSIDYKKGDVVTFSINNTPVTLEYINDISTKSIGYDANPNNAQHLWSVSRHYTGNWVPYHYVFFPDKATTITYSGFTYQLTNEVWPSASNPNILKGLKEYSYMKQPVNRFHLASFHAK